MLKARLAKLRTELMEGSKGGGKGIGEGFDVLKSGDARVALIGLPSVGKSTLLTTLTGTKSEAAAYEFTTLTCIPGVIRYNDANIQLLDLPGIIEGASKGRGRGRQVIAVARTSDLILMMVDAAKAEVQRHLLTRELETMAIRLNTRPPDLVIKQKSTGGISFTATCELTHMDRHMAHTILQQYRMHNADILIREDVTVDQFIDVLLNNRRYIRCLYVVNKIDTVPIEEVDRLARLPDTVVVSTAKDYLLNLDGLLADMWRYLDFIRVYTKPKGKKPSFDEPLILRRGSRVEEVCHRIHRDMATKFKYALVWGTSTKHQPQHVGITHTMDDEDVIQIMTR